MGLDCKSNGTAWNIRWIGHISMSLNIRPVGEFCYKYCLLDSSEISHTMSS